MRRALAGLTLLLVTGPLAAQSVRLDSRLVPPPPMAVAADRWSFGPVRPHLVDAAKRTGYAMLGGSALMGIGLLADQLAGGCDGACAARRTVQTGMTYAFVGAVAYGAGPMLKSKCNRAGRGLLGIAGAAVGVIVASAVIDVPLMGAGPEERATVGTMSSGLLGLSLGTGVFTAIC
jgi:hypothetical protein